MKFYVDFISVKYDDDDDRIFDGYRSLIDINPTNIEEEKFNDFLTNVKEIIKNQQSENQQITIHGTNAILINGMSINKSGFIWSINHLLYAFPQLNDNNNDVVKTSANSNDVQTSTNSNDVQTSTNSNVVQTSTNSTDISSTDTSSTDTSSTDANSNVVPTDANSTLVNPSENSLNITFKLSINQTYNAEFSFTIMITQNQYNNIIKALNKQSFMGYSGVVDTIFRLKGDNKLQNKERNIKFGFYIINEKTNQLDKKLIIKTEFNEESPLKTSISSGYTKLKNLVRGSGKIKKKQTKKNKRNKKRTQKKKHNKHRNKKTQR